MARGDLTDQKWVIIGLLLIARIEKPTDCFPPKSACRLQKLSRQAAIAYNADIVREIFVSGKRT